MKQLAMNKSVVAVEVVDSSPLSTIDSKISAYTSEDKYDAFYVGDLGDIIRKHRVFTNQLPRVEPFYAVKCNDDPAVLNVLAKLGTGFDCASRGEIQKVLDMKVSPDRIIYANPCKQASHIKYAADHDVAMMTFDNETELHKIKAVHPDSKLVVRILPPDNTKCQCQLGMKFGCHPKHVSRLLKVAKELELDVVGVSFHVGSGCYDATAFAAAVASARCVFDIADGLGFHFDLLDIGGGFPGSKSAKLPFEEICSVLRPALDTHFPVNCGVRIIAEPGRYFVASAFTLAVSVIARRAISRDGESLDEDEDGNANGEDPMYMYYVNDGVYGSFNCILFDHAVVEPTLVQAEQYTGCPLYTCSLWGPTCDGLDCIMKECCLPRLSTNDWLLFHDMGAYTMSAASCFNGMQKPKCHYVITNDAWTELMSPHDMTETTLHGTSEVIHLAPAMKTGVDVLEHDMVPVLQECAVEV